MKKAKKNFKPQKTIQAIRKKIAAHLAVIRRAQSSILEARIKRDKKIAAAHKEFALATETPKDGIQHHTTLILEILKKNLSVLFPKDKKTIKLFSGKISLRKTPWATHIPKKIGEEKIVSIYKRLGLTNYLRQITVLDKEAMRKSKTAAMLAAGVGFNKKLEIIITPIKGKQIKKIISTQKYKPKNR